MQQAAAAVAATFTAAAFVAAAGAGARRPAARPLRLGDQRRQPPSSLSTDSPAVPFFTTQGFECRCGQVFCGLHRYADAHACSFDYASHGRAILEKANVKVAGDKGLDKI